MQVIDPRELTELAEFAARGGLGSTVAIHDCVAESPDQLMYISGDTLILLRQEVEVDIAACEGVVGWIKKGDVDFHLDTDTNSNQKEERGIPNTIISSPTPPTRNIPLPINNEHDHEHNDRSDVYGGTHKEDIMEEGERDGGLEVDHPTPDSRRASGPFDLGTPNHSPGLDKGDMEFFDDQEAPPLPSDNTESLLHLRDTEMGRDEETQRRIRESYRSSASSGLGGIGGFMMGNGGGDDSMRLTTEGLKDDSPPSTSIETPYDQSFTTSASTTSTSNHGHPSNPPTQEEEELDDEKDRESWDIYGDYARESMYYKRQTRDIKAMSGMDQAFNLAKALREIPSPPSKIPEYRGSPISSPLSTRVPISPKTTTATTTMAGTTGMEGRSIATELRMKIQKERELGQEQNPDQGRIQDLPVRNGNENENHKSGGVEEEEEEREKPPVPPRSASRSAPSGQSDLTRSPVPVASPALFITNTDNDSDDDDDVNVGGDDTPREIREEGQSDIMASPNDRDTQTSMETGDDTPSALEFRELDLDEEIKQDEAVVAPPIYDHDEKPKEKAEEKALLASPIPLEETRQPSQITLQATPTTSRSPSISVDPPAETPTPTQDRSGMYSPSLDLPNANMIDLPPRLSPDMRSREGGGSGSPWSPSSPASPHSVTATRHAVQVARSVSDGQARMPTLVGKTEGNLLGSKGPVPITFLVDGAGIHRSSPSPAPIAREGLGLGMPSTSLMGRISPVSSPGGGAGVGSYNANARRAATSPLAGGESPRPHILGPDPDSRFPVSNALPTPEIKQTYTPVTAPASPEMSNTARMSAIYPRKTRSRSFGATMARAMGRGKKEKEKEKDKIPNVPLTIDTKSIGRSGAQGMQSAPIGGLSIANMPPPSPGSSFSSHMPPSPGGSTHTRHEWKRAESPISRNGDIPQPRKASAPAIIHSAPTAPGPPVSYDDLPPPIPLTKTTTIDSQKSLSLSPSLRPTQSRSTSYTNTKSRKPSHTTPSPAAISHTDFAEATIKADGLDFEIVQPRSKRDLLSPTSPSSSLFNDDGSRPGMKRSDTARSDVSGNSARSLPLPETDEWGFLKDSSPTPEMYMSRNMGSDHRLAEGKWLTIVSSPVPPEGAPKKIKKLASDSGIPASLRGKVWAWFLGTLMPRREAGRFEELVKAGGDLDEKTSLEINRVYSDHSAFAPFQTASTGLQDLRSLLAAYSHTHPTTSIPTLSMIAGLLLIHCVAEDAYYLLSGIVDGLMKDHFHGNGVAIDAAVFAGVLGGSEKALSRKFKDLGIHPRQFLTKWYNQLFIRCLPWPTALRVIDALVAEGPRFLLIASLSILTLSRERILALNTAEEVLEYLDNLPQDALLLPENYMKACMEVRFKEEDYKRLRAAVKE